MRDDGEHSPETRQLQSRCATLRHALWQSLTPVAGLELAHRNFDCALGVTPIGGVTQSSCEIEAGPCYYYQQSPSTKQLSQHTANMGRRDDSPPRRRKCSCYCKSIKSANTLQRNLATASIATKTASLNGRRKHRQKTLEATVTTKIADGTRNGTKSAMRTMRLLHQEVSVEYRRPLTLCLPPCREPSKTTQKTIVLLLWVRL